MTAEKITQKGRPVTPAHRENQVDFLCAPAFYRNLSGCNKRRVQLPRKVAVLCSKCWKPKRIIVPLRQIMQEGLYSLAVR